MFWACFRKARSIINLPPHQKKTNTLFCLFLSLIYSLYTDSDATVVVVTSDRDLHLYIFDYIQFNGKLPVSFFQFFTCTFRIKMDPSFSKVCQIYRQSETTVKRLPVAYKCSQNSSQHFFYNFYQNSSRSLKERIRIES